MKSIKSNSTRLIVNTGAQYARTIINLVLSLYSTRLILSALGIRDYGVFTLIAGVVSMLAFMTNAMVSTTQRFMSYHQAKSDLKGQQQIFSNSIIMHLLFSIGVLIILEIIGLFLFDGFLNIAPERIPAAKIVYQCAIAMILCSFITAPFKALLISHENIVYISIIDVLDGVLKVLLAWLLLYIDSDKLVLYGYLMIAIYLLNLLAFGSYDFIKYKECVVPRLKYFNKEYLKSMSSFVGWQLYSTGCVIGRTQGTAIILNRFFGTIVNAAFGIALQVSGAVNFISSALVTAINPQIVKAEGSGDRKKMFDLSEVASKFSFLLLGMVVIPICFVMPDVLKLWLGELPEYSVLFCRVILITALLDQITYGLISANQAIGNIGPYAMTINTIKILTLPILWVFLKNGVELVYAIWIYAALEGVCALARLPFLKYNGGLSIRQFSKNVFLKIFIPTLLLIGCYYLIEFFSPSFIVFLLIAVPITILYWIVAYFVSLNTREKEIVNQLYQKMLPKHK